MIMIFLKYAMISFCIVAFLIIKDVNCMIIEDMRMRPNLRWYHVIEEASIIDKILYLIFCMPGLMIGDFWKEKQYNEE